MSGTETLSPCSSVARPRNSLGCFSQPGQTISKLSSSEIATVIDGNINSCAICRTVSLQGLPCRGMVTRSCQRSPMLNTSYHPYCTVLDSSHSYVPASVLVLRRESLLSRRLDVPPYQSSLIVQYPNTGVIVSFVQTRWARDFSSAQRSLFNVCDEKQKVSYVHQYVRQIAHIAHSMRKSAMCPLTPASEFKILLPATM